MILRSRARNREILACPSATKVCWQANWMPIMNRQPVYSRRVQVAISTSSGSSLNRATNTPGNSWMAPQETKLKIRALTNSRRKVRFTRSRLPVP